jgi:hypothetical protein
LNVRSNASAIEYKRTAHFVEQSQQLRAWHEPFASFSAATNFFVRNLSDLILAYAAGVKVERSEASNTFTARTEPTE